jgi:S-adenosylmethionine/arginine decarboxylase-like enzyme
MWEIPMVQPVHQHLLIRAHVTNPPREVEVANQWVRRLVEAIDMKICIEPRSIYVDVPGNEGLTGQVGIETSHIAYHIWDAESPALVQMDVYSCKGFKEATVLELLGEWGIVDIQTLLIDRNIGFELLGSQDWKVNGATET